MHHPGNRRAKGQNHSDEDEQGCAQDKGGGGGGSWKDVAAMGFGQGSKMMQVDSKKAQGLWCPERDK